jgi:hypothetical protein
VGLKASGAHQHERDWEKHGNHTDPKTEIEVSPDRLCREDFLVVLLIVRGKQVALLGAQLIRRSRADHRSPPSKRDRIRFGGGKVMLSFAERQA